MKQRVTKTGSSVTYPINVSEVREHLGITHDEQDGMLAAMIVAAHEWAEDHTQRSISTKQYLIVADCFPSGYWQLPLGLVSAIDSVQYIDTDGATQTWDSANYETDLDSNWTARLRPVSTVTWPSIGDYMSAARVTLTAGWTAANVPYAVRQALLLKVGSLYGSRVPGDENPDVIDHAAELMLTGWRLPPW